MRSNYVDMGKSSFTRVVDKNKDKRGESKLTAQHGRNVGRETDLLSLSATTALPVN